MAVQSLQGKAKGFRHFMALCKRDKELLLIIMLPFFFYIIFKYLPMYGVIMAFEKYSVRKGIFGSPWVGFKWFSQFFSSPYFGRLIINTFLLSILYIIFSFPVPIVFAILLNEIRSRFYQRFVQTVSYMPYFISMVVAMGMVINFLNPEDGIVNVILKNIGMDSINFINEARWFRPIYIISGIWQNFGFNAILYLAAISGIDMQQYEAATIDGATRIQKIFHITIPALIPTFVILLLLSLGNILNIGFEKIILLYNPSTYESADVISTYVYRRGLQENNFGFGTAVGLFNSVVNLVLIFVFNKISKKISNISLW